METRFTTAQCSWALSRLAIAKLVFLFNVCKVVMIFLRRLYINNRKCVLLTQFYYNMIHKIQILSQLHLANKENTSNFAWSFKSVFSSRQEGENALFLVNANTHDYQKGKTHLLIEQTQGNVSRRIGFSYHVYVQRQHISCWQCTQYIGTDIYQSWIANHRRLFYQSRDTKNLGTVGKGR